MKKIFFVFITVVYLNSVFCQSQDPLSLLPKPGVCGHVKHPKNLDTTETEIGEHPWAVQIGFRKNDNTTGYFCSGVLISNRYVLAAGHCAKNGRYQLIDVRLGVWKSSMLSNMCVEDFCADYAVNIPVEAIISNYDGRHKIDDIALIRLAHDVKYSEWIAPACLPLDKTNIKPTNNSTTLTVVGWGKTEKGINSDVKLKRNVSVVNFEMCPNKYAELMKTEPMKMEFDSSKQICTEPNIAPCTGDGPLMALSDTEKSYWYVAGLSSFGAYPCGKPEFPNVNTNVQHFVEWILKNIRP